MRWTRQSPRSLSAVVVTQAICVITLIVLACRGAGGAVAVLGDLLLVAQIAGAMGVYATAVRQTRGTRRTLFVTLLTASAFTLLGRGWWTAYELLAGHAPQLPLVEAYASVTAQLCLMLGFATALGRRGHRNWMRFEAMVDALLLVVAMAIVIVQIDAVPPGVTRVPVPVDTLSLVWNTLAVGNMILVALLLVWRGEALGARLASGLSLGTVALALANFFYARVVLLNGDPLPAVVVVLWTITVLCGVAARGWPRHAVSEESVESLTYASDTSKVRTFSIVLAILIASGSAASLSFRGQRSVALGVALAAFGVLLALRAGYALWTQHRTTRALEHRAIAERELSMLLEQRVAARTRELAEAHRVLQRMWTLGQQIAVELSPERVLQRFVEAAVDVLRADGAAVGLASGERVQIAVTAGMGTPLADHSFSMAESAMGRVVRTGESWWTEDAQQGEEVAGGDLLAAQGARGAAVIPLQRRAERIGAVALFARERRAFSESEISHVEAMADLLSVALANAELVETLRQAEWRFRTLFRAAPDAVLTVFESGRIREANDAVREMVGLHPMQIVGRTLEEFVIPEDRDHLREEFARVLGGAPSRLEVRVKHEGGVRVVSLAARRLPEAEPPMVLFVGRDMTAEREMRARLAETERLAAVGELVAGVAHEVNNPLCTIGAFAQILERDEALTPDQRESVEVIHSETMRASHVLRDLLTFARRSESEPGVLHLNEVAERTLRLRSYEMASHAITAEYDLDPELPPVSGDGRQLQQVVLNLVTNAVQAMAPMGSGTLRVATRVERGRAVLEVSDTGPGVPAEARAHVFEPFFTTKRDGTGLGLSVSYGIVAAHGGTISIAHTSPAGTTFRVSLPLVERKQAEAVGAETPVAG